MANPVPGSSDANACRDCLPGSFSAAAGQGTCEQCPAGTFTPDSGSTACRTCTAGYLCVEGSSAPQPCPGGTHADQSILNAVGYLSNLTSDCVLCPAGTSCSVGSSQPTRCLPGSFGASPGQQACEQCPAGTFTPEYGSTACQGCTGGSYCIEGAATPVYCASGTIGDGTNLTSQANCSASKPGYWSTAGQSIACLTGFYQPEHGATNQTACRPCPTNSTTIGEASTSINDCVCKAEFVYVRLNETDPDDANVNSTDADMIEMLRTGGYCSRCKAGSTCPHIGTTVDDLPVKHGYCNMSRVSNVGHSFAH